MEEKPQLAAESKDAAADEEIARRLQQQLNGEAAAAARRRTRKQPTFYSPQVVSGSISLQASWQEPCTFDRDWISLMLLKDHLVGALPACVPPAESHYRDLTLRHLALLAWALKKWAMCISISAQG